MDLKICLVIIAILLGLNVAQATFLLVKLLGGDPALQDVAAAVSPTSRGASGAAIQALRERAAALRRNLLWAICAAGGSGASTVALAITIFIALGLL